ncbi:MAG TPA: Gfo/Idh/MocA family oxidoreductase [Gemmatimonadales bacterium]|nr:Gfo/Idh/MocA family oxidoreductase [Gemmatimonadales bacterium]
MPKSHAQRRYRGAIIGSGSVARGGHLPAFRDTAAVRERVELVACVDDGPDAVSLDGLPLLRSPEQLRDFGPIDFIDICTPTATHIDLALWGLAQGYHVLCEKPVALTRAQAERLASAARRQGRILAPCHQYRFNPVWGQIAEWLRAEAIGRWYLAEFAVYRQAADPGARATTQSPEGGAGATDGPPWRGTRVESGGGVLVDHGAHIVYQLLDVAGPPTTIAAWTGRLRHRDYDVEDTASVVLEYPDRLATLLLTWAAVRRDTVVRFVGEAGTIELAGGELLLERGGRVERRDVATSLQKSAYPAWFGALFAGFVDALDRGAADEYLQDIRRVAAVLEAAYEAAATGRRLPLAEYW